MVYNLLLTIVLVSHATIHENDRHLIQTDAELLTPLMQMIRI